MGRRPPRVIDAVRDVLAALALLAEAVILKLQHRREGEGVVGAGDVHILRARPGIRPQDVLGVIAGDTRDRAVLVVHVEARLVAAADHPADQDQRVLAVLRPLGRGHDDRGAVVGLDAAIEEVQRLADKAAVDDVLDREALFVIRLRVVRGVLAVEHLNVRDLLGRRAVIVHVAHEGRREALPGALPAIGAVVQHVAGDGRRRARAGAADPHLAVAVHRAEDRDGLAEPGLDDADRDADQRLGRGAAADHIHVEIEAQPQIAGDKGRRRRVAAGIVEHAVDVARL